MALVSLSIKGEMQYTGADAPWGATGQPAEPDRAASGGGSDGRGDEDEVSSTTGAASDASTLLCLSPVYMCD